MKGVHECRVSVVEWCRYTEEDRLVCPNYDIPFSAASIEEAMKVTLATEQLFVAYLPLDFYTMPTWPKESAQWQTPYEGIFYYCVECKKPCTYGAQVCMEFFLPSLMDAVYEEKNMYSWSWLPRLRCHQCVIEAGEADIRAFSYFPQPIIMENILGTTISNAMKRVAKNRKKKPPHYQKICVMCEAPLKNSTTGKFCSHVCVEYYNFMMTLKPKKKDPLLSSEGTTGLFQLLELFDTFKKCKIDVNGLLCWPQVCNRYKAKVKPCFNAGNVKLRCERCHKIVYCSKKCRSLDTHICKQKWNDVFNTRIVILQE